jgi:hypothetical protein
MANRPSTHTPTIRAMASPAGHAANPLAVIQTPDRCYHFTAWVGHAGCCTARAIRCEVHGEKPSTICRDCDDFRAE